MIRIDGREMDVDVIEVGLDTDFIYKFAERTKDYQMKYELGAVFFNQTLTFGVGRSQSDFADLWDLLSDRSTIDSGTGHNVEIWTPIGKLTFLMYPDKISVKMLRENKGQTWWTDMQVKFIAVKPSRS